MGQEEFNVIILKRYLNGEKPKPLEHGYGNKKNEFYCMIEDMQNNEWITGIEFIRHGINNDRVEPFYGNVQVTISGKEYIGSHS